MQLHFANPSYEVMPTRDAVKKVEALHAGTLVHVMCVPSKGPEVSIAIAAELAKRGYEAVPHITARTVLDRSHLESILAKVHDAGITNVFIPGGEEKVLGNYPSGVALLDDLAGMDHELLEIGVPCYPDGHVEISDEVLFDALMRKQGGVATYMVTQLVFEPAKILSWLREMRSREITLPAMVGVPGVVSFQRLIRICTQWRIGQSLRYARMQPGLVGALMRGKFAPDDLVDYCEREAVNPGLGVENIHFNTLNAVAATRAWWDKRLAEAATA